MDSERCCSFLRVAASSNPGLERTAEKHSFSVPVATPTGGHSSFTLDITALSSGLQQKKHHEIFLFERFSEAARMDTVIVDADGEAPDLVVRFDGLNVGVEITELFVSDGHSGDTLQAKEAAATQIVRKAQSLHDSEGPPYAHVSVLFSPHTDFRSVRRDETARQIAAFVRRQRLPVGKHVQWRQDFETEDMPEFISFMNMLAVPTRNLAHWHSPSAGWVAPATTQMLQQRIDTKAARLARYRERVASNWLILVGDGGRPSRFVRASASQPLNGLTSPFDRTYYFGLMSGNVVSLASGED